jgi:hypothetical protein
MAYISIEYNLPLPNEFLVDHSFSEGKTRKAVYNGPDKIWLYIGDDGKENHGPVTAEELADGRPVPADATLFEVDCTKNPLICQLRGPIIPEVAEDRSQDEVAHPGSPVIEGYPQLTYDPYLLPQDIFNRRSLKIVNGVPKLEAFTAVQKLLDKDEALTWDDIRSHRNKLLANSDSQIAEDMPENIKAVWRIYRQKLRDLPAVMQAAGVEPSIAYYMFPNTPDLQS